MDRRTFLQRVGLAATPIVLPIPLRADHFSEPTRPIVAVTDIRAFNYPHLASRVACDGTEALPEGVPIRLEFDVRADPDWPDPAAPSEHFTADILVLKDGFKLHDYRWPHQNIPPHHEDRGPKEFETVQGNIYNPTSGLYEFRPQVLGDVSGNALEASCLFWVGEVGEVPPRR